MVFDIEKDFDQLTKILNLRGVEQNYAKYMELNPNANFVYFDFKKFKDINDTYGHDFGDDALKMFSSLLTSFFALDNNLVGRIGGDEFVLLTNKDSKYIVDALVSMQNYILDYNKRKKFGFDFGFNSGIVSANTNYENTRKKAETMMYYAKENDELYQLYDEKLWNKEININKVLDLAQTELENDELVHCENDIMNAKQNLSIIEITTKLSDNTSIFDSQIYERLQKQRQTLLKKIDFNNLTYLFNSNIYPNVLLNVDYRSILNKYELEELLKNYDGSKGIILSINIKGIKESSYKTLKEAIKLLKAKNIQICLDQYSSSIPDQIFEQCYDEETSSILIDYVKFDYNYWKKASTDVGISRNIMARVEYLSKYFNISPMFTYVETYADKVLAQGLSKNSSTTSYFSGKQFGEEIIIKRSKEKGL